MSRIHQLDPLVVNKIAAGEVIERPASAVKELLENSVDALATRVEVDVAAGGTELIRVVDDGEGIHPDDLPLCVASHATSKISSAEDLFRVQTLGFRGEALASIAAVSQFRIRSRQAESSTGYELECSGGTLGTPQPCGCPAGTQIEIRQLFSNTPVRRKFLRTTATEFGHVSEQFTRMALAHPRLHAVLRHNGKPVYELPAAPVLRERVRLFFGQELADQLIEIESESDNVRLWGYAAHPSCSKSTRKGQYLFLNGRWIQDRSLQHALGESYRGLLMTGRYPVAFLFLEMPAEMADVNVHPTKAEVRFQNGQQLYRQLLSTLRNVFLSSDLSSSMRLDNRHATGQPVDPAQRRELQANLVAWVGEQRENWSPGAPPAIVANPPAPFRAHDQSDQPTAPGLLSNWDSSERTTPGDSTADPGTRDSRPTGGPEAEHHPQGSDSDPSEEPPPTPRAIEPGGAARALQIHDCYLVFETDEGMTVIDQHALHERVLYEQLRNRVLAGAVESQRMLVPEPIEVSESEKSLLLDNTDVLEQLGFGLEEFGKGTLLLSGYPAMLSRVDPVQLLRDVSDQLAETRQEPTRRDILDGLLHMMSCKAAVKAGQRLKPEEVESLLAQRHLIDDSHHCPHGRPTALTLTRNELDRQFGRLG